MSDSYYVTKDRWRTRVIERIVFALVLTAQRVMSPVPLWALSGFFAAVGGRLAMAIPGFRRRAMQNLALVWPDLPAQEHRRIARQAGSQFARLMIEYAYLERFARQVDIRSTGLEHLTAVRDRGKGAVIVTAHYGNWEAVRLAAKRAGCQTGIIFRAFNNRYLTDYTMNLIPLCGEPVLQKGAGGMRQLVAHVARGGNIMILVDQRNSGAPFLDFLGQPAETVTAAAELAVRTGAALIPARAVRVVEGRYFDVTFEDPIIEAAPEEMMQAVNDRIAAWVTEHPEQWFWFHRRWRSTHRSRPKPGDE